MWTQALIRNPVITELRLLGHCPRVAKREPSNRARAFKAWTKATGTNTKQVSVRSGVTYSTLASFVQGDTQSLKGENEELIANAYGVSVAEIFAGETAQLVPIIGRVGADTEGVVIQTGGQQSHDMAPMPMHGSPNAVAVEVVGDSMPWLARSGSLAYFDHQASPPREDMIGYHAIVELEDGRVLLKRLLRGSRRGLYTLASEDGPPIEDVRVVWAAEPISIIPPREAKRIIVRAGERQVA